MPQNNDIYIEQIVKRNRPTLLKGMKIITYLLAFLFGVMAMMALPAVLSAPKSVVTVVLLAGGFGFLSYYYTLYGRIEYEYALTNDELDIDMIMDLRKRKTLVRLYVKDIIVCAPAGSYPMEGYRHTPMKTHDATSHEDGVRYYCLIYRTKDGASGKRKLYFEPDEEMILALKQRNKEAVFDMDTIRKEEA